MDRTHFFQALAFAALKFTGLTKQYLELAWSKKSAVGNSDAVLAGSTRISLVSAIPVSRAFAVITFTTLYSIFP